ncbi:MAG: hypothetical protein IPN34_05095 [Planctomycetes bacterium]|nr:hypothetical protein [Planctomycetota bacterium]
MAESGRERVHDEGGSAPAPPPGSTHADALEHYRRASSRPGMAEAGGRPRNRACPACRGVVPFDAELCGHCGRSLPTARFDYFNYTDFEPDLEARDERLLRRAFGVALLLGALLLAWLLLGCSP